MQGPLPLAQARGEAILDRVESNLLVRLWASEPNMLFVEVMVALSTYHKSIRLSPEHRLKLVVGTKISRQIVRQIVRQSNSHSQFSLSYRADRCPKSTVRINVNIVGTCACLQACMLIMALS